MIKKKRQNNNSGFTLLEAVIYIAIVSLLLIAAVDFHLMMNSTSQKLESNIDTSRNRRIAMNAIDYLVKNSEGLLKDVYKDCSDFDASPASLALYFTDDNYLPGTCVSSGGGVRITVDGDNRVLITCYPNIPHNGWYDACNTTTFPAGNSYYLTSPDVKIYNDGLVFSTSTATSTSSGFINLTTHLELGVLSGGQIGTQATSSATSTVLFNDKTHKGLVMFWKFEEGSGTRPQDSVGVNHGTCTGTDVPAYTTGIIPDSSYAMDFEFANNSSYCRPNSPAQPEQLKFDNAFTIALWFKPESVSGDSYVNMFYYHSDWVNRGIHLYLNRSNSRIYFAVYGDADGSTYSYGNLNVTTALVAGNTYHITAVYDYDQQIQKVYLYQSGVGQLATSSNAASIKKITNYESTPYVSIYRALDGVVDDYRWYNRALEPEEIWALQSQGE